MYKLLLTIALILVNSFSYAGDLIIRKGTLPLPEHVSYESITVRSTSEQTKGQSLILFFEPVDSNLLIGVTKDSFGANKWAAYECVDAVKPRKLTSPEVASYQGYATVKVSGVHIKHSCLHIKVTLGSENHLLRISFSSKVLTLPSGKQVLLRKLKDVCEVSAVDNQHEDYFDDALPETSEQ